MTTATWRNEPHFVCRDCDTVTPHSDLLAAQHPFALETETIQGCPSCREMDLARACDVPDCTFEASIGDSLRDGYHWTCYRHRDTTKETR